METIELVWAFMKTVSLMDAGGGFGAGYLAHIMRVWWINR